MKARSDVKITLEGCNDNLDGEKGNIELSMARANAVKGYLTSIWGIESNRITIAVRNLPKSPTKYQSTVDDQAESRKEENRRVEILVDYGTGNLLEPTYSINTKKSSVPVPEKVGFKIEVKSFFSKSIREWVVTAAQDGKILKQFRGNDSISTVTWDWKTNDNLPQSETPILYSGVIYTKDNDKLFSDTSKIFVKRVILTSSVGETRDSNKVIEKINSILYGFSDSNPGTENIEILDKNVFPKITPDAEVSVKGYTDIIGTERANLSLSKDRARVVSEKIKKNTTAKSIRYEGLGNSDPLYRNSSPEGRFYNRTVQVTIEKDAK